MLARREAPPGRLPESGYDRLLEVKKQGLLEREACRRNHLYWLENYAYTLDEHLMEDNERPLYHGEPFIDPVTLQPMRELGVCHCDPPSDDCQKCGMDDYLLYLAALWWNVDLLAVPKSRQLRVTHLMVNLHGWQCLFYAGQRMAFQSKKFEDADELLKRLHKSLRLMRKYAPHIPWADHRYKEGRITFPNGSIIMAVPQGARVVRQYTFSRIFSDEMGFQQDADDAYTAALPTIKGGGKYTAVSSANPGFFEDICFDQIQGT